MTLNSFEISNHRAISHVECNRIPKLMVIAGPNGVGKSTVLHQLHQAVRRYDPSRPERNTSSGKIDCSAETESVYFSPHRVPGNNSEISRGDLLEGRETRFRSLLSDDTSLPNTPRNLPTQRGPRGPDATAFRGLGRRMAEFTERRRSLALELIDSGETVGEADLPNVEEPIKKLVDQVVPGLTLDEVIETNNSYKVQFENRTGEKVALEDLSSGEIDIITMLFFVAEQQIEQNINEYIDEKRTENKDSVVLIDGPESYLHPYLQLQFIEFISNYVKPRTDIQIIMVTHSEIILNHTPDESLWYLLYPDMTSRNQLLSAENIELDSLKDILGEMGTSALAAGKPLLLVEGKSDREILVRLYPELLNTMTILPMDGKRNIIRINKTLDKLISNLLESGIQLHAIVDRDRGSDDTSSSYIHELPVTDMENTLLQPEALFSTIESLSSRTKLQNEGVNSSRDIEQLLYEIVSQNEIIHEEIRLRINDEFVFEAGLGASEKITKQAVLDRFDDVVTSNRSWISNRFDDIKANVEEAARNNELKEFNGKTILGHVATRFDLNLEPMRLLTAENIEREDSHPEAIDKIIQHIQADIGVN